MNAKNLTDAAKRVLKNIPTADTRLLADHILATVRPDDDEPVTPERLKADGWVSAYDGAEWLHEDFDYKLTEWGDGFICLQKEVVSMGHLRCLVAALGE